MMAKGGGGGGNASTEIVPWEPVENYAENILQQASQQYEQPVWMYPYSTAAPLNPYQNVAADLTALRGLYGNPIVDTSQGLLGDVASGQYMGTPSSPFYMSSVYGGGAPATEYLLGTARGDFLSPDSNPYFDQYFEEANRNFRENTSPGLDAYYQSIGRLGSGSYANARDTAEEQYRDQLNDISASIYDQERQRQLGAAGQLAGLQFGSAGALDSMYRTGMDDMLRAAELSPTLAYQDYQDLSQLQTAGNFYQQQAQQEINDAANRYDYYYGTGPGTDYQALQRYQSFVNPFFSATPITTGGGGSTFGNVLGGALGGASLGSSFGPWGTAIGGLGGGLLGLF